MRRIPAPVRAVVPLAGAAIPTPRPSNVVRAAVLVVLSLALLVASGVSARAEAQETLTGPQIFSQVSPAIALVETPLGSGTGILIGQRHIATAAHVVRPFATADVSFESGPRYADARVVAWDHLTDVAIIEIPAQTTRTPVTIADPRSSAIGSSVYLVGYEGGPQGGLTPAIKVSLLSRLHSWAAVGVTWLEADDPVAGGLSGGAVVSDGGALIGLVQFTSDTASYAISAVDFRDRANRLLAGQNIDGLLSRQLGSGQPRTSWTVTMEGIYQTRAFVLDAPDGTTVNVSATATADVYLLAIDPDGLARGVADDTVTGTESVSWVSDGLLPAVVEVGLNEAGPSEVNLTFSRPAALFTDPDDGRDLVADRPLTGITDHGTDADYYFVDLSAGQTITVTVESIAVDPVVFISALNGTDVLAIDDDSAGGLFGTNAELTFTAESAGRYVIGAAPFPFLGGQGGYVITLKSSPFAAPAGSGLITSGSIPARGVGLIVFSGGSTDQLIAAAACSSVESRFYVLQGGAWVGLIPAAPAAVNATWNTRFANGIPENTIMLGVCRN